MWISRHLLSLNCSTHLINLSFHFSLGWSKDKSPDSTHYLAMHWYFLQSNKHLYLHDQRLFLPALSFQNYLPFCTYTLMNRTTRYWRNLTWPSALWDLTDLKNDQQRFSGLWNGWRRGWPLRTRKHTQIFLARSQFNQGSRSKPNNQDKKLRVSQRRRNKILLEG